MKEEYEELSLAILKNIPAWLLAVKTIKKKMGLNISLLEINRS